MLAATLLLASCCLTSPCESTIKVSGTTGEFTDCVLTMKAENEKRASNARVVSGSFVEVFSAFTDPEGHSFQLTCGDEVIAAQWVSYGWDHIDGLDVVLNATDP